jgi:hypothetical protein
MESPKGLRLVAVVVLSAVIGALAGSLVTYGLLSGAVRVPSRAQVKSVCVDAFNDADCTVQLTMIDWGFLEPGQTKNCSAYLKSTSNAAITVSMSTEDWNPLNATSVIGCVWDAEGRQISADEVIAVNFILAVNESTAGLKSFSFTVVITGSG